MIKIENNIQLIKAHLKQWGGLLITNRRCGKSQALLELIHENPESFLLTYDYVSRDSLKYFYRNMFPDNGYKRIHSDPREVDLRKTYIDEYFAHPSWYKYFLAAVATMPFPIAIRKYPLPESVEDFRHVLLDLDFRMEFGLEFPLKEEVNSDGK